LSHNLGNYHYLTVLQIYVQEKAERYLITKEIRESFVMG